MPSARVGISFPISAAERCPCMTPNFPCVYGMFASFIDVLLNIFAASFQHFYAGLKPSKSLTVGDVVEGSKRVSGHIFDNRENAPYQFP